MGPEDRLPPTYYIHLLWFLLLAYFSWIFLTYDSLITARLLPLRSQLYDYHILVYIHCLLLPAAIVLFLVILLASPSVEWDIVPLGSFIQI